MYDVEILAKRNILICKWNGILVLKLFDCFREKLSGRFFELNIHYGLFIGGQGEFSELFLGHVNWFRGCLSDLLYNGVYPLNRARHRHGLSEAYDISWNCASEFYADTSKDISFIDVGSFMSLPNTLSRVGTRYDFQFKNNCYTLNN